MLSLATKFVPIRAAFETAFTAGFRAAEFWLDAEVLDRADEIAALAGSFPFRYALHFPNHKPITESTLTATVKLYRDLQCTATVIHHPMFERFGGMLRELAPEMDLAIENHVLKPDEFDTWAEKSPGLTLDVEHLWKFTLLNAPLTVLLDRVEQFLERHAHKLHHVHLPGYLPGGEEHCPIHFDEEMATAVMTRLAAHGFQKLVVSELDNRFQTREYLERDVQMFGRWLATQPSP